LEIYETAPGEADIEKKTMLLCGVIDELRKSAASYTVSYFFCQATDERLNKAISALRSLLYLLVDQQPSQVFMSTQTNEPRQALELSQPIESTQ
jgi:hypothetical protein